MARQSFEDHLLLSGSIHHSSESPPDWEAYEEEYSDWEYEQDQKADAERKEQWLREHGLIK